MRENLDRRLWNRDTLFCGVDEAGRGALAGPVVAAAVIMPPALEIDGVDDSKKLSPRRREQLERSIKERALGWAVAQASHKVIDRCNVLAAAYRAMLRAIGKLDPQPALVLVDGWAIPDSSIPCEGIINGDCRSHSIACASILAKVYRDRLMVRFDRAFPGYYLARHKGYCTPQHVRALGLLGACPIHRRTFGPVRNVLQA